MASILDVWPSKKTTTGSPHFLRKLVMTAGKMHLVFAQTDLKWGYIKYLATLFTVLATLWASGECADEPVEDRNPTICRLGELRAIDTGATTPNISAKFILHGFVVGGVNSVNVDVFDENLKLVTLIVEGQNFQGAMSLGTTGRVKLTSDTDYTNSITLNIIGTGFTTTDEIQRELNTLFQLDTGAPVCMHSESTDLSLAFTNMQVGAATPPGTYGLSYGYNSTANTITYKVSNGLQVWERSYDAFVPSDAILNRNERTIVFDNGLTITTAANNDETNPVEGMEIINVENPLWQSFYAQAQQLSNPVSDKEALLFNRLIDCPEILEYILKNRNAIRNLKQNLIDLKQGLYTKLRNPSLITSKNIVPNITLAPPALPFNELYENIMNNIDAHIDSNDQQWDIENMDQLAGFFQGTHFSKITTQAARPIRVINDSIARKINVYYALRQVVTLNSTYDKCSKRFELCLSRSTLTKEEQAEKYEAELMLCEEKKSACIARKIFRKSAEGHAYAFAKNNNVELS